MNKFNYKKYKVKFISWISVVLWMALIFHFSAQPATQSKEISNGVMEVLVETVEKVAPNRAADLDIQRLHYLIRKNAHFFSYLVLGILVLNARRRSGRLGDSSAVIALIICIFYAISDEIHQLYVPGRSGELRDVIIDSVGASVGIVIYLGFSKLVRKKRYTKIASN